MTDKQITSEEFFKLIHSGERDRLEQVSKEIIDTLSLYLRNVLKADKAHSDDFAQQAFYKVYERIKNGEINDKENIYGYFIASAKNEFLMNARRERENIILLNENIERYTSQGRPVFDFADELDSDRKKMLMECVQELDSISRKQFFSILEVLHMTDDDASLALNMTYGSYRTRKSRIFGILHQCVRSKIRRNN